MLLVVLSARTSLDQRWDVTSLSFIDYLSRCMNDGCCCIESRKGTGCWSRREHKVGRWSCFLSLGRLSNRDKSLWCIRFIAIGLRATHSAILLIEDIHSWLAVRVKGLHHWILFHIASSRIKCRREILSQPQAPAGQRLIIDCPIKVRRPLALSEVCNSFLVICMQKPSELLMCVNVVGLKFLLGLSNQCQSLRADTFLCAEIHGDCPSKSVIKGLISSSVEAWLSHPS